MPSSSFYPSASQLSLPNALRKSAPPPHLRNSILWVVFSVCVSFLFSHLLSPTHAYQFLTAYLVEYSLSVDNLFVFLLIFRYFSVPPELQTHVLFYGILTATVLRGVMIFLGRTLMVHFHYLPLLFALLLLYSSVNLLLNPDDSPDDISSNTIIRMVTRILPVSNNYSGAHFFTRENNVLRATPLLVVLVAIELSDVVFALDSVPAVLGISDHIAVVYVSNILAVMGLRSLFFVLATSIAHLRFLRHSLATVLGFISVKMLLAVVPIDIPIVPSLLFVVLALSAGVICSILFPPPKNQKNETGVGGANCV